MSEARQIDLGTFRLDPDNARLWRGPEALRLSPKAFAVLHYLAEHAGQLVTKDDLLQAVWPGIVVSEAVLTICIGELRKVLGESPKAPQFIETVHKRGYRWIAPLIPSPTQRGAWSVGREGDPFASVALRSTLYVSSVVRPN
jgi:DNA-binding winged helix-turn-helix (wHTH) protein